MAKEISETEALGLSIEALKDGSASGYGYDFYPAALAHNLAQTNAEPDENPDRIAEKHYSPVFFDAAWVLCQRGVIRPGVRDSGGQSTSAGGYSLTSTGKRKLKTLDSTGVLIMNSDPLSQAFAEFESRFGGSFTQRAIEAIKCRDMGSDLACCAMAGAAAEAVLIATAVEKTREENAVLTMYQAPKGLRNVQNLVTGGATKQLQEGLSGYTGIISMWRDEAAHGKATLVNSANSDEALRQLLRFCQFVEGNWDELTA